MGCPAQMELAGRGPGCMRVGETEGGLRAALSSGFMEETVPRWDPGGKGSGKKLILEIWGPIRHRELVLRGSWVSEWRPGQGHPTLGRDRVVGG